MDAPLSLSPATSPAQRRSCCRAPPGTAARPWWRWSKSHLEGRSSALPQTWAHGSTGKKPDVCCSQEEHAWGPRAWQPCGPAGVLGAE